MRSGVERNLSKLHRKLAKWPGRNRPHPLRVVPPTTRHRACGHFGGHPVQKETLPLAALEFLSWIDSTLQSGTTLASLTRKRRDALSVCVGRGLVELRDWAGKDRSEAIAEGGLAWHEILWFQLTPVGLGILAASRLSSAENRPTDHRPTDTPSVEKPKHVKPSHRRAAEQYERACQAMGEVLSLKRGHQWASEHDPPVAKFASWARYVRGGQAMTPTE